jgi:hypothetical protein
MSNRGVRGVSETGEVACTATGVLFEVNDHVNIVESYEGKLASIVVGETVHLQHVITSGEVKCLSIGGPETVDEWIQPLEDARDRATEWEFRGDGR